MKFKSELHEHIYILLLAEYNSSIGTRYSITINCEDEEEVRIINSARANYRIVNDLYDEVFRPVVKYGESEEQVKLYLEVWDKIREYYER